jgi:hypothetical protein
VSPGTLSRDGGLFVERCRLLAPIRVTARISSSAEYKAWPDSHAALSRARTFHPRQVHARWALRCARRPRGWCGCVTVRHLGTLAVCGADVRCAARHDARVRWEVKPTPYPVGHKAPLSRANVQCGWRACSTTLLKGPEGPELALGLGSLGARPLCLGRSTSTLTRRRRRRPRCLRTARGAPTDGRLGRKNCAQW